MSKVERDAVFAALADDHRRVLLERLRRSNGQTLSKLGAGLGITRQAVTKHLVALEEASLVLTQKRGREKLHFLNPVPINAVAMRWLRQFDGVKLGALIAPETPAEPKRANAEPPPVNGSGATQAKGPE